MADLKAEFSNIAGYMLRMDVKQNEGSDNGIRKFNSMTKLFNFLAREVTTIHRDWVYEPRGGDAGGTSAIATHTETKSFDDLASAEEVRMAHKKLQELGGAPPALDSVLPDRLVKPSMKPASLSS